MGTRDKLFKYECVANTVIQLIESGTFRPGDRVPSVREMSQRKKISVMTVMQAYYQLEAQGYLEARPRSGFYVRMNLPYALPEPEISSPAPDPSEVSMYELVKRIVLLDTHNPDLVQLGAAHPNPELTAARKLNRLVGRIGRELGCESVTYDYPPGCPALRVQIAQRAVTNGCTLSPDDIVTTNGCGEAVSLCLRSICQPGDAVAVESPMSFDALQTLEGLRLQALEIPTHPRDGISLDALRFAVRHTPVRACMVISNFNNPLGSRIPEANKQSLVEMLAKEEIPLIENNIFGEIYFRDRRPVIAKSFDREGYVMLCSSFSKDLAPGYRVGWTAPGRFKAKVEWLKYTSSLASPTLPQLAIAQFMSGGGYDHHLRRIRREYARNVSSMVQAVRRHFPSDIKVTRPQGGFVLWIQLPDTVDSLELYGKALQRGVAITPGYLFSASDQYRHFIRLNAANWTDQMEPSIGRLGGLVAQLA